MVKWAAERPTANSRIIVIDKNGRREGHLDPLYWDGEHLCRPFGYGGIKVKIDELDWWCYYNDYFKGHA